MIILYIISLCLALRSAHGQYNVSFADTLKSDLTNGYITSSRPLDGVNVTMGYGISSIHSLDIVEQKLSVTGFLIMSWSDPRLQYDSTLYGNMDYVLMLTSDIWVPPIILNNAASGVKVLNDGGNLDSVPLKVASSGEVHWLMPVYFEASCSVNIQYYPFDSQTCSVEVSSFMYNANELRILSDGSTNVNTDMYATNGEWDLTGSSILMTTRSLLGFPMSIMTFSVDLKRKYSYFILNMILPVIFLALLGPFVFMLPTESGAKNGFSLTILLSFSVVMTAVSNSIPPTSEHLCILSLYLLITFTLCSIQVLLTVMTVKIYAKADLGYTPPLSLQRFMQKYLSKVAFYTRANEMKTTEDVENNSESLQRKAKAVDQKEKENDVEMNREQRIDIDRPTTPKAWYDEKEDNEKKDFNYKDLAIMTDKINFVLFFTITFFVTACFLIVLMTGDAS